MRCYIRRSQPFLPFFFFFLPARACSCVTKRAIQRCPRETRTATRHGGLKIAKAAGTTPTAQETNPTRLRSDRRCPPGRCRAERAALSPGSCPRPSRAPSALRGWQAGPLPAPLMQAPPSRPPGSAAGGTVPTPAPPQELAPGRDEGRAGTCPGGDEEAAGALERCWRRLFPRHAHLLPCSWRSPLRRAARRDAAPQAPTPKRPPLPVAPASRFRGAGSHHCPPRSAPPAAALAGRWHRQGGRGWDVERVARGSESGGERKAEDSRWLFNFSFPRGVGAAALVPLPSAAAS